MISGLFHPDWAFFFETDTSGLGYLLLETVCIALVGTCAGTVIAVPLSFLSTPCLMPQLPALLFRVVIMAIRSVPFLIYGWPVPAPLPACSLWAFAAWAF